MKKILVILFLFPVSLCHAQTNYALGFNGSSSYVQVNDNNAIDLSGSFSIEAWIYPTGAGSDPTLGGIIINKESSYEIARFANGTIQFALSAAGDGSDWAWTNTSLIAPLNQWSHIALVKNGTSVTVYLNSMSSFTSNSQPSTLTANTQNLRIGNNSSTGQYFQGYIDEVRIWNTSRTQAEIKSNVFNRNLSNSATGLVAYYQMNEGSSSITANSSTNTTGIDGTLVNSPSWQASPIQFAANAINFDGADDFISIPHSVSSDFTIEYWIKTNSTGPGGTQWYSGNGIVDAEVGGVANDWGTSLIGGKLAFGIGAPDVTIISSTTVNTGSWVHVAVSWKQSNGQMNLYINGNADGSTTGSTNLRTAPPRITLGELQTNGQRFNGSIDELRIWNEVRSQAQIQADMNKELDPSVEPTLLAYYTFDQGISSGTNTGLTTLIDQKGNNNGTLNNFSLSGASSNFILQNNSLFVLPLQWLSFTVQKENKNVLLQWSTGSEQNTRDFIIQQSANSSDWNNIGIIAAAGNSTTEKDYSYIHTNPGKGINYYRILETDMDGRKNYSEIRSVKFTDDDLSLIILNNPVINGTIQVKLSKATLLSLYSNEGKLLWQRQVETGTTTINVNSYAKGIYLLKAGNQTKKITL